jgi:hypothetical protein
VSKLSLPSASADDAQAVNRAGRERREKLKPIVIIATILITALRLGVKI